MVQGQIHQAANSYSAARAAHAAGIKAVPKDITLRVLVSKMNKGGREKVSVQGHCSGKRV